jgi:hypothetical protein
MEINMFDHPSSSDYVAEYSTTSPLVRLKRRTRGDDIEDDWNNNDNEENDGEPAGTSSSKKGSAQLDPMREALACRADIAKLESGYHKGLYAELGRITQIARDFDRNGEAWARFVKDSFWADARKQDRPHIGSKKRPKIAFVTRFVWNAKNGPSCKLTSKYSGVLEYLIADGVKPEHIAKELKKRGGIEKIHRLATKRPARPKGTDGKSADHSEIVTARVGGGPVMSWNRKMRKAANELEVGLRVRLECEVVAENDGEISLKVMGVTKRK